MRLYLLFSFETCVSTGTLGSGVYFLQITVKAFEVEQYVKMMKGNSGEGQRCRKPTDWNSTCRQFTF